MQHIWIIVTLLTVTFLTPSFSMAQETPLRQIIDAEIQAVWKEYKVNPAPRAGDTAFLRRIYLDLVGTVPS